MLAEQRLKRKQRCTSCLIPYPHFVDDHICGMPYAEVGDHLGTTFACPQRAEHLGNCGPNVNGHLGAVSA